MTRRRKAAVYAAVLVTLLIAVPGALLVLWSVRIVDLSPAIRSTLLQRLEKATGRQVAVDDLRILPSFTPVIVAENLRVANASWAGEPYMLAAERVAIEIRLWPMLTERRAAVERLEIDGADIAVERNAEGKLNWNLATGEPAAETEDGAPPWLADGAVEESRLRWRGGPGQPAQEVTIDRLAWTAESETSRIAIRASGKWRNHEVAASGQIGSLAGLLAGAGTWPVDLQGRIGRVRAAATGALGLGAAESRLVLQVEGERLSELGRLAGANLPALGSYRMTVELVRGGGSELAVPRIDLVVGTAEWGRLDLQGRIAAVGRGGELDLAARAQSQSLQALGERLGLPLPALGRAEASARIAGTLAAPRLQELTAVAGGGQMPRIDVQGGRIGDLLALRDILLPVTVRAGSLAELGQAIGYPLPAIGAVQANARLELAAAAQPELAIRDLDMRVTADAAHLTAQGSIGDALGTPALDLRIVARGDSAAAFARPLGISPPALGPFEAQLDVSGDTARGLRIETLSLAVADSRAQGSGRIELPQGEPPRITGTLAAQRLDLDRLLATGGAASGSGDDAIELAALRSFDADLALRAEEIVINQAEMGPASARLNLENGRLVLRDLALSALGGSIRGGGTLRAAQEAGGQPSAAVNLHLRAREIDLAKVLRATGAAPMADLEFDFEIAVDGRGQSADDLLASLDGDATVVAQGGEIRDRQLNRLVQDVDLLRILPPFWRRTDANVVRLNCVVGNVTAEDGTARTRALIDTRRMTILGKGSVELPEGSLDFTLDPDPKSRKLSAAGVPVQIGGTVAAPTVNVRGQETAGRLLRGLFGGLLLPLNQIAGLIGEDARDACGDALREARRRERP